ncbi:MAG: PKD domain-containing protein [Bacteroidetes bacterium]|nr:PKD domain-containing protein [Bacteroidota bacterium]
MRTFRFLILTGITGLLVSGFDSQCPGQNVYTIGTGTNYNSSSSYPAPYGGYYYSARHQMLIRASELTAAGASAGNFISLAFNVYIAAGYPLTSFTIRMKSTSNSTVTSTFESTGFTTVWGPQTYTETTGWNTHNFSTPFYWNGTSNVLIDICFNNTSSYSNARTYYTSASFTSTVYYYSYSSTCLTTSGYTTYSRPNMRIGMPANAPPVPDFGADKTETCNGLINFYDSSYNVPTTWYWDFGDGGSSLLKNPSHTYTTDGNYSVKLKSCNGFGCDSITKYNYISAYNLGTGPINASCAPGTLYPYTYYGLFNVTFNTINNTSTSGTGYQDYTCDYSTSVIKGMSYAISVKTGTVYDEDVRVWIDYNNNGTFSGSELIFSSDNVVQNHSGTISIPSSAVENVPIRMRVLGDDSYSAYAPCTTAYYGQFEDYTVTVQPNTYPPDAKFTANNIVSCSGTVTFYDSSAFIPTSWLWDFGDGSTSTLQNPNHTYANPGLYTVTLKVCNTFGCDSIVKTDYVDIRGGGEPVTACTPMQSTPMANYGIYSVKFGSIDMTSSDAPEGNKSFTCVGRTYVVKGQTYPITVNTGSYYQHDVRVWIDYDNNGNFAYTELVFSSDNIVGNHTGNISIPSTATVNTPLRMRILGDYYTSSSPCSSAYYGQYEDYSVVVIPDNIPPIGDFTYEVLDACQGIIKFSDKSMPNPSSWKWDFGDGLGISISPNPYYTYSKADTYLVTMIVINPYGDDTVTKTIIITAVEADFTYMLSGNTATFTDISVGAVTWMWDFGDGYAATIPDPVHTYTSPGTYYVKLLIYNSSGCMEQTVQVIVISGIAENNSTWNININPNPAKDILNINYSFSGVRNISLEMINVLGETVYSVQSRNSSIYNPVIDLSGFKDGIYFIRIMSDDALYSEKVILAGD